MAGVEAPERVEWTVFLDPVTPVLDSTKRTKLYVVDRSAGSDLASYSCDADCNERREQ